MKNQQLYKIPKTKILMEIPAKPTPMMKQFLELKQQYSDCILLFRAGDFYETFFDDAKTASQILSITLTKRGGIPMAGVPFHSITPYIKKLVQNNFKVALCEQLEDPKQAKGLVKRGVTRVITPGTILEDEYLTSFENNFIMCIYQDKKLKEFAISIVDITTGEFQTTKTNKVDELKTIIKKYSPTEIVLNESFNQTQITKFIENSNIYHTTLSDIRFNSNYADLILKRQFDKSPQELKLQDKETLKISCGALLFYIFKLQKLDLSHITDIKVTTLETNLILNSITLRNLEITESLFLKDKKKTLFGIINNTKTPQGARLLKSNLVSPYLDTKKLEEIYDSIEEFNELILERNELREILSEFTDIQRITSRINSKLATPKDLVSLKQSIQNLPKIKEILFLFNSKKIQELKEFETLEEITNTLENAINEDAPNHTRDIGFIKKDYNQELKELFDIAYNSKTFIKELEEQEKLQTQIPTLKIKFNKIFGYFIEIPKSQENKVPQEYILKQTLANNYRYTKPELKEKESIILGSEDKIKALELKLFDDLVEELKKYTLKFQEISEKISQLDVISTHSYNSQLFNYCRPTFNQNKVEIIEGRNPIVEQFVNDFVVNDTIFDETHTLKIVTGPNMAGKSTYLRQTALISILAQSGSFTSATKAQLKVYDKIFTRIGAHDELSQGQSTFMVEMSETADILNNATKNSLVLLDEIGRGTSTYDGLSIAWAVTEEIAQIKANCIFATHYHQLNTLTDYYENIKNYNVLVREEEQDIIFIRKIVEGGTDKSYGIHVGKLAGIPKKVLERAKLIQNNIENKETIQIKTITKSKPKKSNKEEKNSKLNEFM